MADPQLEVRGLSMHFALRRGIVRRLQGQPKAVLRAVDGVDLEIAPGEALGLVGDSGCGKSTLGRVIVRLQPATSGHVYFQHVDLTAVRAEQLRRPRQQIEISVEDPDASLNPRMDVPE